MEVDLEIQVTQDRLGTQDRLVLLVLATLGRLDRLVIQDTQDTRVRQVIQAIQDRRVLQDPQVHPVYSQVRQAPFFCRMEIVELQEPLVFLQIWDQIV